MIDFWESLIEPYLVRHQPRIIVVVGGEDGALAARLIETTAAWEGVIHIADPAPACDIPALRLRGLDRVVVHEASGQDVLELLAVPDFLLLDLNPNWYTVQSVLSAVAQKCSQTARRFPMTLLANTAWPYARRDGYRSLVGIPEAFRQAHERAGLRPGQAALCASFGLFTDKTHATEEFGPRNGVLTALEDFAAQTEYAFSYVTLPMLSGITFIHAASDIEANSVTMLRGAMDMGSAARRLAEAVEQDRLSFAADAADLRRQLDAEQTRNDLLHDALRREQKAMEQLRASRGLGGLLQAPLKSRESLSRSRRKAAGLLAKASLATRSRLLARRGQEQGQPSDMANIERLRASPVFDAQWYLDTYGDVAASGEDPASHYYHHGAAERRDPGPYFSTDFYLATNEDVALSGINPLLHYLSDGAREGRDPNPSFSSKSYMENQIGAVNAKDNPLEHYLISSRR
jgi:hypothetical protein